MVEKPEYVLFEGHRIIVGPGIDDVLEGMEDIILLDDYYADIYGDYTFLGYETFHVPIRVEYSDLVNLHNAAYLMSTRKAVIVCGDNPQRCIYALAAYLAYNGVETDEALSRATALLRQLYGEVEPRSPAARAAVNAIYRLVRAIGRPQLDILMSLAANYGWGWGDLHYSCHVSWTSVSSNDDAALLASALHFLTEGPGDEKELLDIRLDTLGRDNLRESIKGPIDEALRILEDYASKRCEDPRASLLWFIEKLDPEKSLALLVEGHGDYLVVYCRASLEDTPAKTCVEKIREAIDYARKAGFRDVKIRVAEWTR